MIGIKSLYLIHKYIYIRFGFLEAFTDDDGVVIGDEHLAVHVDELGDQLPLQLGVRPEAGDGEVVDPLVPHWKEPQPNISAKRERGGASVHEGRTDSLSLFSWEMMECSPRFMVLQAWKETMKEGL